MTVYQNIPLGNAVSRATIAGNFLEIEGISRCYEWAFGEKSSLEYRNTSHRIELPENDRHQLVMLLETSQEPYDPDMDFHAMKVGYDSGYLGERLVQMPDLSGHWYSAGLSLLRDRDTAMLYARFDTGRNMDEREAYDTIIPLTQEECMQLVRELG